MRRVLVVSLGAAAAGLVLFLVQMLVGANYYGEGDSYPPLLALMRDTGSSLLVAGAVVALGSLLVLSLSRLSLRRRP